MNEGKVKSASGAKSHQTRISSDDKSRERALFDALKLHGKEIVKAEALLDALRQTGLQKFDPRLAPSIAALEQYINKQANSELDFPAFKEIIRPCVLLIERALQHLLIIPEFQEFRDDLKAIFNNVKTNNSGKVADYIPQLTQADPELFSVAICTIDGQSLALGDADYPFCVQSSCKPMNYCLALEEHGAEIVHKHIGCEPSGQSFNELTLNKEGRPHNPMINAGAIMSCSLIKPDQSIDSRFDYVSKMWQRACGGVQPGFSNPTYLSERRTSDRNFALGYSMREHGAFPENTDLIETLEFYFQLCSLEVTAKSMATFAATLANGGVCPLTEERVFRPDTVQQCLSLMYSCGMYDFSGEWAFTIGLPAKSGVSGVVFVVVPNTAGLCIFSPRLDEVGNSVRGVEFCKELVKRFNFHNYDNLVGAVLNNKKDPRIQRDRLRRNLLVDLCWAAAEGDLRGIKRLVMQGVSLDDADYDGRTGLHLAASEGRTKIVEYFLRQGADPKPIDRWGNTPLDDARRGNHPKVASLLERASNQQKSA